MSLWNELKRRNVLRVTAAYVVVGWLVLQVADIVFGFIGVPDWVGKLLITLLVLGFAPVIAIAWIFELTPEGIKRESDLPADHQNQVSARRLDYLTIGAVVVLAFITFYQQFRPPEEEEKGSGSITPAEKPVIEPDPFTPRRLAPGDILEPDPQSVAVLPFANRSAEEDTRYFVDGIHDDLLTQLAKIGELTVISRTSVMEYRDTTKNMKQIGEELGVAHILEGAVQKAGQRVRVNAQLIDADTDRHLWAESFDRELTADNLFDIQSDIARAIARALASTLTDEELDSMGVGAAPTDNQMAYDLYLQARAIGSIMSSDAPPQRIELLKQAVELDPEFALAVAEIGYQYTNWYWFLTRSPEHEQSAHEWLERARAMDPDNPLIHWYWADHLYHGHLDFDGALEWLRKAEDGLPNLADIFNMRGWILRRSGRFDEAITAFERAVQLDPLDQVALYDLAFTNAVVGNYPAYRRWMARFEPVATDPDVLLASFDAVFYVTGDIGPMLTFVADLDSDTGTVGYWQFMAPYLHGDYELARENLSDWPGGLAMEQNALLPRALAEAMLAQAEGSGAVVEEKAADAMESIDAFVDGSPEDSRGYAARALAYALMGEPEKALVQADRAVALTPREKDALTNKTYRFNRVLALALSAPSVEVARELDRVLDTEGYPLTFQSAIRHPFFDRHRDSEAFRDLEARHGDAGS